MPMIYLLSQNPEVVDKSQWSAINVGEISVAGEIIGVYFHHVEADEGYTERDIPVELPLGATIYGNISGRNTGTERQWMRCTMEVYDPDGVLRGSGEEHGNVNPGVIITSGRMNYVTLDKPGNWVIKGILEAEPA